MVHVECPWCDADVVLESEESFRCDGCDISAQLAECDPAELSRAA